MATWTDWKLSDIIYGIILPLIAAFLLIFFPTTLRGVLDGVDPSQGLSAILVDGLADALLVTGIPLFAGLIWNKWAGGGAGFITGSIYALYINDVYASQGIFSGMTIGDITNLGFVVSAMLIGFMAGALNRGSYSFRRMVIAALVAGLFASLIQIWVSAVSTSPLVKPDPAAYDLLYNAFTIALPKIIYGIIIPIFVTLFGWFGITPRQMT
jgi:hypothetical protein